MGPEGISAPSTRDTVSAVRRAETLRIRPQTRVVVTRRQSFRGSRISRRSKFRAGGPVQVLAEIAHHRHELLLTPPFSSSIHEPTRGNASHKPPNIERRCAHVMRQAVAGRWYSRCRGPSARRR